MPLHLYYYYYFFLHYFLSCIMCTWVAIASSLHAWNFIMCELSRNNNTNISWYHHPSSLAQVQIKQCHMDQFLPQRRKECTCGQQKYESFKGTVQLNLLTTRLFIMRIFLEHWLTNMRNYFRFRLRFAKISFFKFEKIVGFSNLKHSNNSVKL